MTRTRGTGPRERGSYEWWSTVDTGPVPTHAPTAQALHHARQTLDELTGEQGEIDARTRLWSWRAQARKPRELRLEVRVPSDLQSIYRAPYYPGEDAEAATWRMVRVVVVLADVRRHVAEVWSSEARDLTMAAEWYRRGHWRLLRA